MARMTLLEMTQNILSAMNSDEVNSINDTVESMQVAEEIKTTFYELFTNTKLPEQEGLVNLQPGAHPHILLIPNNVYNISWVKYRNYRVHGGQDFVHVKYLTPEEFIQRFVENVNGTYEVPLTSTSSFRYFIDTTSAPSYYTIFNSDNELIFDSFDLEFESHLTGSNSLAWGTFAPNWQMTDDFVPPVDAHLFPMFLHEARSACFINIKEVGNSKEEQRARRQRIKSQTRMNRSSDQRMGVFSGHDYARKR